MPSNSKGFLLLGFALLGALALAFLDVPQAKAEGISQGDVLVRLRGLAVLPNDDSDGIRPGLTTTTVGVGDDYVPELDFTYMFTDNIGAELILGTTKNDLYAEGALSSLGQIGYTRLLPPTLALQYHFMPKEKLRPYVGVGVNYTILFDENAKFSLENALSGATEVELDNTFGYALQAGVDFDITESWFINLDFKYIDISPDLTLTTKAWSGGATTKRYDTVDINPFIVGFGIGTRF